ncbi:MAG TPA: hypothetical protein VM120_29115 [Bryobacteraceae bacterium]|nr:hypothetical protein [Bryobacteraceae bacterium]
MTSMERLAGYIATYDPPFAKAIAGADAADVQDLEAALGRDLPPVYLDFLNVMGKSMDWLRPANAAFDAVSLTEYYREQSWRPEGFVKIALGQDDPFFDIYLEDADAATPRVVTMPRGPTKDLDAWRKAYRHPLAGSLTEYLGTSAYNKLRMAAMPEKARMTGSKPGSRAILQVEKECSQLSLQPVWFSNDWVKLFYAEDAGAVAKQFPGTGLAINVAARTPARLNAISGVLCQKLGLKIVS